MKIVRKIAGFILGVIATILGVIGWILTSLLQLITLCLILGTIAAGLIFVRVWPQFEKSRELAYDTIAQMDREDFSMLSDTEIFDKDGNRIGLINAGHYEYVDINHISMNIQNAYIAQEDRRFKSHNGVDWIATLRAGVALIKHRGEVTQGGSTITQQVIKNSYLTQEQTFTRKIVEVMLAPELEKKYSKADIMEFYCNMNFYGHHCYGVEAASRYYFGKHAADLEVWEAAVLVGLSNSPSAYDPVNHPESARAKRNEVLKSMLEVDMLTEKQYTNAINQPMEIVQTEQEGTSDNYLTGYAIHCAALELMKNDDFEFQYLFDSKEDYDTYQEAYTAAYSEKSDLIRAGGYKIYTSLDPDIQNIVQEELDDTLSSYTELQENGKYAMQGAGVVVDNRTNYVVAVVGGRGTEDQYNRAYLSARQPGSTIKPLIDYAPAFDTGEYYPSRIVDDHQWEGGPSNSGGSYYGPVTVREALNRSLNTVAWQILQDIGIPNGLDYLGNMEFQKISYVDSSVPSLAIGGFTNGVRVVDMAKGYAALANQGVYDDRTCITGIESQHEGDILKKRSVSRQVYSIETAYMMTDVLKGTFTTAYGTGRGLGLENMPCAGKTGTTNSSKDTWFCGYTRYYTMAVWVGYDNPRAMPGIYGSTYAGAIWQHAMDRIHSGLESLDWEKPDSVILDYYDGTTGARLHPGLTPVSWENAVSQFSAGYQAPVRPETAETQEEAEEGAEPAPAISEEDYFASYISSQAALRGVYVEPSSGAGTDGADYFCTTSEVKAEQSLQEKERQRLITELESQVSALESATITSAADINPLRRQYNEIVANMNQLESGPEHTAFYNRITRRWAELESIMDGMTEEIQAYKEKEALKKQQEQQEADALAEIQRQQNALADRKEAFETILSILEAMSYRSEETDQYIQMAIVKYGELSVSLSAEEQADYKARMETVITNVGMLPDQASWEASRREAQDEESIRAREEEQELLRSYLQERSSWSAGSSYGPGGLN